MEALDQFFRPMFQSHPAVAGPKSARDVEKGIVNIASSARNLKGLVPPTDLSWPGVNWRAGRFRDWRKSSPKKTQTSDTAVNIRRRTGPIAARLVRRADSDVTDR
jgi:hypothetical protein